MKAGYSGIRLILYSSERDEHLNRILASVPGFFAEDQVMPCADSHGLASALQEVLSGYGIVLMLLRSRREINAMTPLRDRLRDHSVILILDNSDEDLTHEALKLYPRYTSCLKTDYQDIFLVLGKMITKIENTIRREENG